MLIGGAFQDASPRGPRRRILEIEGHPVIRSLDLDGGVQQVSDEDGAIAVIKPNDSRPGSVPTHLFEMQTWADVVMPIPELD